MYRRDSQYPNISWDMKDKEDVKFVQNILNKFPEYKQTGIFPDGDLGDVFWCHIIMEQPIIFIV
jgi:hypothetical protein